MKAQVGKHCLAGAILNIRGSGGHLKEAAYVCPLLEVRDEFRQLLRFLYPRGVNGTLVVA